MIKKKKKRKVDPAKSWAAKVAHARRRRAQEFAEQFKPGDWVTIKDSPKTMAMLLTAPYVKKNSWSRTTYYMVDVQLYIEQGQHVSYTEHINFEYVNKFKPWPYFYGRKDKKDDSEETRTTA